MKLHEGIQKTASGNEYVYTVFDDSEPILAWHSVRQLDTPIYVTKQPYMRYTRPPDGKEYETLMLEPDDRCELDTGCGETPCICRPTIGSIVSGTDAKYTDGTKVKVDNRGMIEF